MIIHIIIGLILILTHKKYLIPVKNIPVVLFCSKKCYKIFKKCYKNILVVSWIHSFFKKFCARFLGWFLSALLLLKIIVSIKRCYGGFWVSYKNV